jgi:hypothetical protein
MARTRTHHSVNDLTTSIRTWADNWNNDPKPFVWHKTADEILDTLPAHPIPLSNKPRE